MDDEKIKEKIVPDVDYAKSVKKGKLVYKKTLGFIVLDYTMTRGVFVLFATGLVYGGFQAWYNEQNYVLFPIGLLFSIWIIISLFYINTLVEVKGSNIVRNKEDAMNTLKHFYESVTFDASKENMIRDVKPTEWNGPGRVLTVILDGNTIYFHKASLMRGSVIFPVWGLMDYLKSKEMAEYFVKLQATAVT